MNSKSIYWVAKLQFGLAHPREVVQEIYGWLLGHWASLWYSTTGEGVRSLMFQVAEHAQISPLRLSNTCTLNVVRRRAVPKFQRLETEALPFFGLGL